MTTKSPSDLLRALYEARDAVDKKHPGTRFREYSEDFVSDCCKVKDCCPEQRLLIALDDYLLAERLGLGEG
jgi:hypothetical protein